MDAQEFKFPFLAIRESDGEIVSFRRGKSLPSSRDSGDMGGELPPGGILTDANGRAWDVHARPGKFNAWGRFLQRLFKWPDPIEPYLVERAPLPFAELMELVCDAVGRDGESWYDAHLRIGEPTEADAIEIPEQMEILKGQLRQCRNLEQLVELLCWTDWQDRPELLARWARQ